MQVGATPPTVPFVVKTAPGILPAKPAKLLIIRPSALGDVCRSVPVLASLAARFPEATIDWLVQDAFVPAIASHPALRRAIPFPRQRVAVRKWWTRDARKTLRNLLRSLRDERYDAVFDCQGLGRSGAFTWATRAPLRVGHADAAEFAWLAYTRPSRVPPPSTSQHTVDRMLGLVEAVGVPAITDMRLYTSEQDRAALDPRLVGARYAVVAPTSRWAGKRWPADRFAHVIDAMLAESTLDAVAIVASHNERDQCAPILDLAQRDPRIINLVGVTPIGALMATIEAASLVIANDSAALHMGVGFDRPILGLFGPTSIARVGPYQRERDVIQTAPPPPGISHKDDAAGAELMQRITTQTVIDAALERLAPVPSPTPSPQP